MGGIVGATGLGLPGVELAISHSVVVFVALAARRVRLRTGWSALIVCHRLPEFCRRSVFGAGYKGATGPTTETALSIKLTTALPGLDTVVTRYTNAPPGGAVELWTIVGGSHRPTLSPEFQPRVIDWLFAHPRP